MKKLIIGVGHDDTVVDLVWGFRIFHNIKYGTELERWDFTSYDFAKVLGLSQEEAERRIREFHESQYFRELCPMAGAIDGIAALKADGHKIADITSRSEAKHDITFEQIEGYFKGNIDYLFYAKNHYTGIGEKSKKQICLDLNAEVMVDNSLYYLRDCMPEVHPILLNQPWSQCPRGYEEKHGIVRVSDWPGIVAEVRRFAA